jgi:hypothetical protein
VAAAAPAAERLAVCLGVGRAAGQAARFSASSARWLQLTPPRRPRTAAMTVVPVRPRQRRSRAAGGGQPSSLRRAKGAWCGTLR